MNEDATITYTTTGGNENPFYNEMVGLGKTQNVVASGTAVQAFVRNNDPRRFAFYERVSGQDTIAFIAQGAYASNSKKIVSKPSSMVGGNALNQTSAVAPVKLFSASESLFLQAEAIVRGWGSGDAQSLYRAGITESFKATGNDGDAAKYITDAPDAQFAGDVEAKVKAIITQKYYAMCGFQGFEAWTEWRRTGYPTFFVKSAASTLGEGRMPLRMPYALSEATTNSNYPGNVVIYTPVWWDVK